MKTKFLFAAFLLACCFTSYAQKNIPKGSLLLGGNFSFNSSSFQSNFYNQEIKSTGFTIAPAFGVAVKDNLVIGLSLGYSHTRNKTAGGNAYDSASTNGYVASVYARKYKPLNNNFYVFLQGSAGVNYNEMSIKDVPGRIFYQRDFWCNLSVTPGISYAINSKLQVEAGFYELLGISYVKSTQRDNASPYSGFTSKRFSAYTNLNNFTSQLYIGFRLLLQKKSKQVVSSKAA